MSFLSLSCSAIMDSPGGEFNNYAFRDCEVFQNSDNIVIDEDFGIMES